MSNTIINGGASPYSKHVGPAPICSFSDGAQDAPLKSLKFYIEPQQDLHGYDYPWPAGGEKNKLPPMSTQTKNGFTITNDNGVLTFSGRTTSDTDFTESFSLKAGTYNICALNTVTSSRIRLYISDNGTNIVNMYINSANRNANFTIEEDKTLTFGIFVTASTSGNSIVIEPQITSGSVADLVFAPYSNICPISGWTQVDGKQSGEDMTDYTPITIALGQTVYGGTVDALNGKLVIDRAIVDLGSLTWEVQGTPNTYQSAISAMLTPSNDIICSMYPAVNATTTAANMPDKSIKTYGLSTGKYIIVKDSAYATTAAFKTAMNGVQLVYPLATPIEVDLTPVSVNSLLGQNNVWASCGDTELDYYPAAASVVAVLNRSSKVYTSIPLGKIRYDTYQTTPNQALDLDSYRAETGVLIRNVLSHTATKIEFNTPSMTNLQWEEVWNIIKAGFNNSTERKLKLKYYDQMSATYKTGWFYVPDVNFTIRNIDEANGIINYDEIRVAFIEY